MVGFTLQKTLKNLNDGRSDMKYTSPKRLLQDLVDAAYLSRGLSSNAPPKVGEIVTRQSDENRELLKQLTPQDNVDDRWPRVPNFEPGFRVY